MSQDAFGAAAIAFHSSIKVVEKCADGEDPNDDSRKVWCLLVADAKNLFEQKIQVFNGSINAVVRLTSLLKDCLVDWKEIVKTEQVEDIKKILISNPRHHLLVPLLRQLTAGSAFLDQVVGHIGKGDAAAKPSSAARTSIDMEMSL